MGISGGGHVPLVLPLPYAPVYLRIYFVLSVLLYLPSCDHRRRSRGSGAHLPPQCLGKIFFGQVAYDVKFGHFINFHTYVFWKKYLPQKIDWALIRLCLPFLVNKDFGSRCRTQILPSGAIHNAPMSRDELVRNVSHLLCRIGEEQDLHGAEIIEMCRRKYNFKRSDKHSGCYLQSPLCIELI